MSKSSSHGDRDEQLSHLFICDATLPDTLHRIAELAVDVLGPASFCGLTILVDGEPVTGVFTDPTAPEIDQAKYDSGNGPCLDSFRTGEIFRVESTTSDQRWPEFSTACANHGILSTMSLPIILDGRRHGALNLYSRQEAAFGSTEIAAGRQFAAQAAVVIGYARAYWRTRELSEHLQRALEHRAEIEQAKGIIIAATGVTPDEAFETLARQSQHENRKLRDVAIELVQSKTRRPVPRS